MHQTAVFLELLLQLAQIHGLLAALDKGNHVRVCWRGTACAIEAAANHQRVRSVQQSDIGRTVVDRKIRRFRVVDGVKEHVHAACTDTVDFDGIIWLWIPAVCGKNRR